MVSARSFLIPFACFCLLSTLYSEATAADRPNILLIYADDQSTRTVGCYPGSWPWVKTPHIDHLAEQGIRFSHCYLGSWCMPSRATLLTGRLPHGIQSMSMKGTYPGSTYDPQQCPFWPKVFREHGYQTAQIGKWHTGTDSGFGRDWDYQAVWNRPKNPKDAGNYYRDQIVTINGVDQKISGYPTDKYTDWACEYIRGENRLPKKPWYLWLCYGAVHGPSTPAPRHIGHYADAPVEQAVDMFPPRTGKPEYLNRTQAWFRDEQGEIFAGKSGERVQPTTGNPAPKTYADWVRQVNECAISLDEGVGRVLAALRDSGQLENTLVIYTADQGFAMGEHGFRAKVAPYDANYSSPLIISQPGTIPQGTVCRTPAGGADLVQTFFSRAGIELPWKMHGRDLSPFLSDPQKLDPDHVLLFEHMGQAFGTETDKIPTDDSIYHNGVPRWIAIRKGPWKYIRTLIAGETEELYHMEDDPDELQNLALLPERQELLSELREAATSELRRTQAGFADEMPITRQMSATTTQSR
ncbi:MAG: sulfatase-like hydrolase/transferase [Planctomyces sp.]